MNLFMIEKTFVEPLLVWTVESLKLSVALFITLFTTVILTEQQDFFFFYQKDATFFVNAQYWQTTTDVSLTHFSTNVSLLRRNQQLSMMSDKKCPTANTRWGVCDLSNFMNKWQHRNETWKCTKDGLCAQLTADLHSFVSSIKAVIFPNLITLPHNGGRRTADVTAYPNHCGHFLTNITIHAGNVTVLR